MAETLATNLLSGLLQLTVEQISRTEQYEDGIRKGKREIVFDLTKTLPPFKTYVEFVPKYGSIEIAKIRYDFEADTDIDAKEIRVEISENRISATSFGSFVIAIKLSLLVDGYKVELGTIRRQIASAHDSTQQPIDFKGITPSNEPEGPSLITDEVKFCTRCDASIQASDRFCSNCGSEQVQLGN